MTAPYDEAGLRHELIKDLATTIAGGPDIDGDKSSNDLGVGRWMR